MNKHTADGGPHKVDRIRDVADGLRRIGEFESAEMLDAFAALLKSREDAKTVAWMRRTIRYKAVDGHREGEIVVSEAQVYSDDIPLYEHPPAESSEAKWFVITGTNRAENPITVFTSRAFTEGYCHNNPHPDGHKIYAAMTAESREKDNG